MSNNYARPYRGLPPELRTMIWEFYFFRTIKLGYDERGRQKMIKNWFGMKTWIQDDEPFFHVDPKLDQAIMYLDKRTHLEARKARSMLWFDIQDCRDSGTEVFFQRITPPELLWLRSWRSGMMTAPVDDTTFPGMWDASWDSVTNVVMAVNASRPRNPVSLRGLTVRAHDSLTVMKLMMYRVWVPGRIEISIDHLIITAGLFPDQLGEGDLSLENVLGIFCEQFSGLHRMWATYIFDLFSERCIRCLEFTGNLWESDARAQRKFEAIEKLKRIPTVCEFHAIGGKWTGLVLRLRRKWSYSQSDLHIIITALRLPGSDKARSSQA